MDELLPFEDSYDEERILVMVGSFLFWALAVDEQLKCRHAEYLSVRNGDLCGELLAGLKLGRNAVAHGIAPVVVRARGLTFPLTFPLSTMPATWATFDVVRVGLDREPKPYVRRIWETRLAGQRIDPTLRQVREWLGGATIRFA